MTETKRFYVSDVQLYDLDTDPSNEPVVREYTRNFGAAYPSDLAWALVIAKAEDHAGLLADSRILAIPNYQRDDLVSMIPSGAIADLMAGLTARGISTMFMNAAYRFSDIIEGIGKQAFPEFTYAGLNVH